MKKILLFIICVLFTIPIWGQIVGARSVGNEKWGFVDANGNWVIQPIYELTYWYDKWNLGKFRNKFGGPEGLLDASGKVVIPIGKYKGIHCERGGVYLTDMSGKKGVATFSGNVIVPCLYDIIVINENGYIIVYSNNKVGLRNQEGYEIIPCAYDNISIYMLEKENYCDVKQNGKIGLYHIKKKKELLPCVFDNISYDDKIGLFKVKQNGKHGLYNAEGKEIISCKYDYLSFDDKIGLFKVKQNGKHGLYNAEGKEIIPCKYDYLSFDDKIRLFKVEQNGKYGLYNAEGEEIIPCKFDRIWEYDYKETGCFRVELNDKEGAYNDKGKELLQCIYDDIYINSDYIRFKMNEKYGLYSIKENKEVIKPNYYNLYSPSEDLILYQKVKEGKYGYLDVKGNIVIEAQYDNASSFEDGIAQVTKNGVTSILKHPLNGTNLDVSEGSEVWVDIDIPQTSIQNEEAFAFIIANENYNHFSGAAYSHNDGKVFAEYSKKTLGLPENNVRYYEDATYGNIANALKQLKDIADVYDGEAKIIFYFSGLGITDEKTNERYILPSDASLSALGSTGFQVNELMGLLNQLKSQYTLFIVDAPFNGNGKDGKPITSDRGVKIANKKVISQDNVVGLIGGEEGNGYSCKQLQHSILTYSLLEKLKTVKGECCIGDMIETSFQKTREQSLKLFKEVQTPQKVVSEKSNKILTNKMM